jgi:hypothetical protein
VGGDTDRKRNVGLNATELHRIRFFNCFKTIIMPKTTKKYIETKQVLLLCLVYVLFLPAEVHIFTPTLTLDGLHLLCTGIFQS